MSGAPAWWLLLAALAGQAAQEPESPEPQEPWVAHVEPATDEAERVLAELELPPGFVAELYAAEPRVANPVCLYVDHAGDVWVAETFRHFEGVTDMREHPTWLDEDLANRTVGERLAMLSKHEGENLASYARATDRVRWLSDTDGDGRADVDAVFAEGFTAPEAGIGAGLLVHGGDVYYTCIPDLWLLRDEDGNRRAEGREVLSTGYGVNIALLGHDLHGLRIGPDGKLYFSSGDRGFHVETEAGTLAHPHTGAVLRCDLDGSNLEVFATGLRNPQELVFDEFGNLWTGDNNSDGGDQARWVHVVEGSDSGWRYSYQWLTEPELRGPWNEEQLWHPHHAGQAAYILPPVANLASGPSGVTYDRGTGLPDEFARHFFLCDFRGDPAYSGIHAFTVVPKGAGWELGPVQRLLWNGLPTDVDFGPDGSLYVSDWVDGWDKTGKGRVFRVFAPDALAPETARLLGAGSEELASPELGELLDHADQRVRQMAQLELVRRGERELLKARAFDTSPRADRLGRLHALWGLGMLGANVTALVDDDDPEIRAQMCRILGDSDLDHVDRARMLGASLYDEAERVRMHAAIGLGKVPARSDRGLVDPLIELLRRDGADPVLRHAAVTGLVGQATPAQLVALSGDDSREVRLGAVVALRRLDQPGVQVFLNDGDPLVAAEAARAIYDVPIEAGMGALAELIERPLPLDRVLGRRVVNANHQRHDERAARALLRFAARADEDAGLRVEALERLRDWDAPGGRDPVTGAWRPVPAGDATYVEGLVARALADGSLPSAGRLRETPGEVLLAWAELLARYPVPSGSPWLEAAVLDAEADTDLRARALAILAGRDSPALSALLERALFDDVAEVRAQALTLLGEVDAQEAFPMIEAAATRGEHAERRAAYGLLARSPHERAEAVLAEQLQGLGKGAVPPDVTLELVTAAAERGGERLEALLASRAEGREDAALAPYLDGLYGGDAEAGRELFIKGAELQCLRCHATGEEEADLERAAIGPALAGLGARSTRLETLTSIVDPNRAFADGFRGTLFFMRDDTRLEGQVLDEDERVIRVLDAEGEIHELDPAEVEARRAGLSSMPEGLAELITPAEMRDLLEFLSHL